MFKYIKLIIYYIKNIINKHNKIHCLNINNREYHNKYKKKNIKIAWDGIFKSDMLNSTCPICLEDENMTIKLPCNHWFHKECILDWFKESDNCPLCRTNIKKFINKKKK